MKRPKTKIQKLVVTKEKLWDEFLQIIEDCEQKGNPRYRPPAISNKLNGIKGEIDALSVEIAIQKK